MSIEIDGKTYRNLQEQVAYNDKRINEILETLDGLNVQDNVVVVPDMSYVLNAEELEVINREVAFIIYDGQLYIKKTADASSAYFDIVFTITSGTVITLSTKEIEVTLSNGALGITIATYTVYSKAQTDTLLSAKADIIYVDSELATKADLSGANFTGGITAPSIVEDMSGYSFTVVSKTNLTKTPVYAGVVKTGNKITFVVACKFERTDTTSTGSDFAFNVPSSIGSKLYETNVGGSNVLAVGNMKAAPNVYSTGTQIPFSVQKDSNTYFRILLWGTDNLSLNTEYFGRIEITFLLSDNLAS